MQIIKSLLAGLILVATNTFAAIPEGYYSAVDGLAANELKSALTSIISKHNTLAYSDLWDYYPYTYYCLDNPDQVLDLYSSDVTYFSNYSALNREHVVPQAWWGGSTDSGPGCDLFNVIPSETKANSAKADYPLGKVATATFDNGVIKVGSSAVSGYTGNVFEPVDKYKGDFARIYLYVAACYPGIAWDDNKADAMTDSDDMTLKSWIIPTLLEWNAADPVDEAEIQRNEDIAKYQANRNPFIDYPELADYIWGNNSSQKFNLAEHVANEGQPNTSLKTKAPVFSLDYGTPDNPKAIADGTTLIVRAGAAYATLHVRVNSGSWQQATYSVSNGKITFAQIAVTISGETTVETFCTNDGYADSDTITACFSGTDLANQYLLYEAFDAVTTGGNTLTGDSGTRWSGNDNFPDVSNAFCAGYALRLGSSSDTGSITSRTLNTAGGTIAISLDIKGWTTVEGDITVSLTGAAKQTVTYSATIADDFEHAALTFTNVSANPTLTIATTAKRAFVDNIIVYSTTSGIEAINFKEADDVNSSSNSSASATFNLAGQRINANTRGIVIQNGKKVLR
ncbi:MAG: endonuclease [Prevotella sp.]|nr:endonuclease [Prevotella sp.]